MSNGPSVHDVIVIGSGPAGVAAAITCRRAGLQVTIITGACRSVAKQMTHSLCLKPLESFHPGIVSVLKHLHATAALEPATKSYYEGIYVGNQFSALGADQTGPWQGYHVDRRAFDAHLLQIAKDQGIAVLENEKVVNLLQVDQRVTGVITSTGRSVKALYTLDGSGRQRVAGKRLLYQERYFSAPLVTCTGVVALRGSTLAYQNRTRFIPQLTGWSWIAPLPPDKYSWTRLSVKNHAPFDTPSELQQCKAVGKVETFNARWRVFRPLASPGIILTGDAAGIIDPAYGQGVLTALRSGISAAHCAIDCMQNSTIESFYLAGYDDWFMRQYEEKCSTLRRYYSENMILV